MALILLVFALVCAVLATFGVPTGVPPRVHLGWASIALYLAYVLVAAHLGLH